MVAGSNDNIKLRLKVNWDKVELDTENVSDPGKNKSSLTFIWNNLKNTINSHTYADGKRGGDLRLVKMLASELSRMSPPWYDRTCDQTKRGIGPMESHIELGL